jgi:RNA polymerase sigma-70 factor, ECF subfamily
MVTTEESPDAGESREPSAVVGRRPLDARELVPVVYDQLRAIARGFMRDERFGHTLQATALVHEAVIRLIAAGVSWQDELHFRRVAARCMLRILNDYADARAALKRGGGRTREFDSIGSLSEMCVDLDREAIRALAASLEKLEKVDPRGHDVAVLLFIHETPATEVASMLGISRKSVHRQWVYARAWLARELSHHDSSGV